VVAVSPHFSGTGVSADNLVATIGAFVLAIGIVLALANVVFSLRSGVRAGHDPWRGTSLEWFALSPPPPHNFDVLPDVRSHEPLRDIRDAIRRQRAAAGEGASASQPVA
jgi:cytochrome c oxidase subunit I